MDLLFAAIEGRHVAGIVHCWGVDAHTEGDATTAEYLDAIQDSTTLSVLHVLQALTDNHTGEPPKLFVVSSDEPGDLSTLVFQLAERPVLKPDEVEISTLSVGMNFKDVMQATGLLKGAALEQGFIGGLSLGLECSGTITAVGAEVKDLKP